MFKVALLYVMIMFYFVAGINHFINPKTYYPLFPTYLKNYAVTLNLFSGIAEVLFAVLLLFPTYRSFAGYAIIAMLVAFIPAHIYMIQKGNFVVFNFTVTTTISWIRLLVFQPLFMYWAYYTAIKK